MKLEGRFRGGDCGQKFEGRKVARAVDGLSASGTAEAAPESNKEADGKWREETDGRIGGEATLSFEKDYTTSP